MIELKGIYNTAKVFTETAEQSTLKQVERLLDQEFIAGSKVRVMPDAHAGMGCTIGTTMTITDKVVPNLVGVDIGCGMETVLLKDKYLELEKLDKTIHQFIPSGFKIRQTPHHYNSEIDLTQLRSAKHVDLNRAHMSIGTLGGGNHFIELGKDDEGQLYLVVHSGSRNLGKQVCVHYQKAAVKALGRTGKGSDQDLAYLEGSLLDDYLHDMAIIQRYAVINRKAIVRELEKRMKFKVIEQFTTIHNYIDLEFMILRKGAISAQKGEKVLIPMNMRDGSLICIGKGNEDWNYSAPHGAGRTMSRTEAKGKITLTQFEKSMKGIYSSTINRNTIDEAPFAYKPMEEIVVNITDTVDIVKTIKPLYNFKAAE
ncbi:MAG: RtcB family protein [Coriobacteriia bacterium]|nr:RtcB family protein [Coriobacteriia bacterium]MCL2750846.1 RtcB family protein [Coriobacteriia bacterium]